MQFKYCKLQIKILALLNIEITILNAYELANKMLSCKKSYFKDSCLFASSYACNKIILMFTGNAMIINCNLQYFTWFFDFKNLNSILNIASYDFSII